MDRNNTVSQETCCIPAGVITEPDVSLQLEGKAYKEFSLRRVISSLAGHALFVRLKCSSFPLDAENMC